ncbi:Alkaline_phosphatase [Hexamita inflata]|uniref:alkaline phosphatase n=1 Tax=Hexamita inflata TaxID=28002 RepID=A0AA86QCW4_9EUKA|nr:Alkaline phosphatase [Hexamita inflata]
MLPSIVLVIVDGMGPTTMEAARIVEYGNVNSSVINYFEAVRPVSTQNIDDNLTDSAAAGTAISTGQKTTNGRLGMDKNGVYLQNLIEYMREQHPEYVTGIISKIYSGHATPASFLVHKADRSDLKHVYQSMVDYSKADLIVSAGYKYVKPFKQQFEAQKYNFISTTAFKNNANIISETQLPLMVITDDSDYMPYFMDEPESTLIRVVRQSIDRLNKTGPFFLMVECSLVDFGGHEQNGSKLVGDMIEADLLLRELLEMDLKTVLVADHETGGVTITGDLKGLDDLPLPGGTDAHLTRKKRIEQLGLKFTSTHHSNSFITFGAHGFGPVNWVQTTSDVRRFINLYLDGVEPMPYVACTKNEAENIFKNRFYFVPGEDSKKKPNKAGIIIGTVMGFMGVLGIAAFVYVFIKRQKVQSAKLQNSVLQMSSFPQAEQSIQTTDKLGV